MDTVWTFKTARFTVELLIEQQHGYEYDGDDDDGETQAALNAGDLVAFDSVVRVSLDGGVVASDHLGGSVYKAGKVSEFWTEHLTATPQTCHFPDMVRSAITQARKVICAAPRMRCGA